MKTSLRVIKAFLFRDAVITASYRMSFAFTLVSLAFSVISVYFSSKLISVSHPAIAKYGGYLPYAVVGMSMVRFFSTGFSSFAGAIRSEQSSGTLEAIMMTPTRLSVIVLASSVWDFFWTLLTSSLTLLIAAAWFDLKLRGNPLGALLILALTTLVFSSIGIFSASFIMVFKRGDPFKFLIGISSLFLGGVIYPISLLPSWLQKVSYVLPVTHGVEGLREILLLGCPFSKILMPIAILSLYAIILLPLSLFCFKKAVRFARREGSLLHY